MQIQAERRSPAATLEDLVWQWRTTF